MKLKFTLEIEPEDLAEFLKAVSKEEPVIIPEIEEEPIIIPPVIEKPIPEIPKPPIEPEVPVIPPAVDEIIDITDLWYSTFKKGFGEIIFESGKTYKLTTIQRQKITGKVRLLTTGADPAYLWVGKKMYLLYVDQGEDTVLFLLADGAEVVVNNIYPSMPEQSKDVQARYSINWFEAIQDPKAKWTAIVKNCDTTFLGRNGGFGMGTLYGGEENNHVAFINYKHAGPMLKALKNPYPKARLTAVFDNVTTDYSDPSEWQKRAHKTTGVIIKEDNILYLTGDVEASCLYNHFFNTDKGSNRSTICHIGRFTFMIDTVDAVLAPKVIQLRRAPAANDSVTLKPILKPVMEEVEVLGLKKKVHRKDERGRLVYTKTRNKFFFGNTEPHPSDTFSIQGSLFTITEKLKTENDEWTNEFGEGISPATIKAPQCFVDKQVELYDGTLLINESENWFVYETETIVKDGREVQELKHPGGVEYILDSYASSFNQHDIDQDIYLIYKADFNFRTLPDTKFGDWQILSSRGDHISYDHGRSKGVTMWARGLHLQGYVRESDGEGISDGYNLIDCTGFKDEFNPGMPITTDKPMPEEVAKYLT